MFDCMCHGFKQYCPMWCYALLLADAVEKNEVLITINVYAFLL